MKYIVLGLLLIAACTNAPLPEEEQEEIDYGDLLFFTFPETEIPLDGEIIIESVNTTETVHIYTYCDMPFNLLQKQGNKHVYVYPTYEECNNPVNTTYDGRTVIKLTDIPFGVRDELEEGEYLLKVFYSTAGPGTYMREHNQDLTFVS